MAVTAVSDLASLFPLIYEDALFVARDNNLMTNLVTMLPQQSGYAARKIGIWNSAVVMEVGDGVDFSTNTKFSESLSVTFTPTEKMAQFIVTDAMVETAADREGVRTLAARELGLAMATKIDTDLVGVFANFTNTKGSAGNALSLGILSAALVSIRRDNAKGMAYAVLDAAHWHDIWTGLAVPAATYAFQGEQASEALRTYYKGELAGMQFFVSNNIDIDADDDAVSGVFVREAIGMDPRKGVNFEEERDASLRGWEINVHAGYAVGTIRADHGCAVTADATEPTS